ncbi:MULTISPECIES: peptidoglycan editing factor PgeF [unclassified Vibrio]|uniref:peptidoglycan editing factor PgeF n=1 Tax=unclassified Vibrio TaxID=2614977 RepID=UPI0013736C5B|nr:MULTISPECIES: peptidoglycan editing factor PgeF [unclassified Vibrio]NAW70229.1 peptidoglycan editing factor PgeF [Vibrio sp. V28_P6S34P95]NAX04156.1 peptidoglycan editing factor PgeF [Vibrio sp. V30_P3S12P165]NAX34058.1 peptidoglycan editing factor PgeF [Vibrio sp. V29_P1S30P107]NAX38599.1 peptidoglycan editing factor PgeF [Vibrio sp. V27_P1S3P104]
MDKIIPNWPAPSNIKAFASTRIGGFSPSPYQGLNLGMHVGDDPALVLRNREWLQTISQMPSAPIWLNQTHSTKIVQVERPTKVILDADGLVTTSRRVVCSVITADCLPVLITNSQGTQVAAVHAGWRGLAGGIVENALHTISGNPLVWLGPAIGAQAFEVGNDVRVAFCERDADAAQAFLPTSQQGKWLADMVQLVRLRLAKLGIEQIYACNLCTYQNPQQFYSYRRDGMTGRQASFIWME